MKMTLMVLMVVAGLALGGCVETDLGDKPLLCNQGEPRCPEGYVCLTVDKADQCVKEGSTTSPLTSAEDGGPELD